MPDGRVIQNSFNAGEISPLMEGRTDFPRYANSAFTLENWIIHTQGGVSRRWGLKYIAAAKSASSKAALIPFLVSDTVNYVLEFGNAYIRFFQGGSPVMIGVGGDRVVNGAFPTDLASWTDKDTSDGVSAHSADYGGSLKLTTLTSGTAKREMAFATVIGQGYEVEVNLTSANPVILCVGSSSGAVDVKAPETKGGPRARYTFTAISSVSYVQVYIDPPMVDITVSSVEFDKVPSDLTAWTDEDSGGGVSTVVGTSLSFTVGSSGTAKREQEIVTVIGDTYTVTFKVKSGTVAVRIGTATGLDNLFAQASFASRDDAYSITFTATTAATFIQVLSPSSIAYVDDVTCIGGNTPYEIVSTYLPTEVLEIQYAQSNDVMYLVHPNHPVRKLSRLNSAGTSWDLRAVVFLPPPTLEKKRAPATTLAMSAVSGIGVTATAGAAYWLAADVGSVITSGMARAVITAYVSTTEVTADVLDAFASTDPIAADSWHILGSPATTLTLTTFPFPVGSTITLTLTANGWRSGDVGKYVKGFGGTIKITGYTSALVATGVVQSPLTSIPSTAPYETLANTWTLEEEAWSSANGYPSVVSFYEQRLCFGGSTEQPQTLWGSATADFENFAMGVLATDAVQYEIASNEINTFRWMSPSRVLLIGALAREFRASGGQSAITPSNIDIRGETSHGSMRRRPVQIGHTTIFIHSSGRKIREMQYNFDSDSYKADDFTVLNPEISEGGFQQIAYSQEPYSILYAVRNDGQLCALTYEKSQEVMGWGRIITDGEIESICILPADQDSGESKIYVLVKRTIGGAAVRYVEMFDSSLHTDCAKSGALTTAGTAVSGLSHLEGKTVTVVGDGKVQANQIVASGAITAAVALTTYEIGLPFTATLVTVRPEMQVQGQSSQGKPKRWADLYVRVHNTIGIMLNGDRLWKDGIAKNYQTAVPTPETGDLQGDVIGIDGDARLTIVADLPFPATVLMVVGELSTGD